MSERTRVVWDPSFTRYDFGRWHPMSPVRLELTARLCSDLGLFALDDVDVVSAAPASDDLLRTVHGEEYVAAVKTASADPHRADEQYGLGTDDDPAFRGMHEAAARIVGGTVDTALAIWRGEARHGVNFCGGMHHAKRDTAAGFCVYNDAAVAIQALLDQGCERVAYIDLDVHHGDGTEAAFWDDPRVLTLSVHESGRTLFPGTGYPDELGGPGAEGSAVNLALPAGIGDAGWLRAVAAVAPPLVRAFAPQVLITQHGCDTHALDPLGNLTVSVDAQAVAAALVHDLAHEVSEGRWLALGGGGYEVVDVVPRTWAQLVAIAVRQPLERGRAVPESWRRHVEELTGRPAPRTMSDGVSAGYEPWSGGYDPADPVDRAVLATRRAAFPLHGLDPEFD
ncbi:acetoin utilization protein AcuC [Kineococcus gynurae]|uniref:Acetoin utilization protein AcuC n=1 Tax=Kineococcus gynurae TaxID=452979 RepID=A0ABV5LTP7_9ACTN